MENLNFSLALARTIILLNITKVTNWNEKTLHLFTSGEYATRQSLDIETGFVSGINGTNWFNIYDAE